MVKGRELVLHDRTGVAIDTEPVFKIYAEVCGFYNSPLSPQVSDIYDHYAQLVEGRVAGLKASYDPDGFYDGSPGSSPNMLLPDSIRDNISEHIRMNYDADFDDIKGVLEAFHMFHFVGREVKNAPVAEVW